MNLAALMGLIFAQNFYLHIILLAALTLTLVVCMYGTKLYTGRFGYAIIGLCLCYRKWVKIESIVGIVLDPVHDVAFAPNLGR